MTDLFSGKQFFTPNEVAELFKVSPVTVRQWAQKGLLPAQVTAGGHRRFTPEDLQTFAAQRGITLDAGKPRLLVVDDNRQFNNYLIALFNTDCPAISTASAFDGFEAGRLVQQFKPTVVLLDIMMPGMDGVEVCRSLQADELTKTINIIAMTGHHSAELEGRVLAAGARQLLKKPFSAEQAIDACQLSQYRVDD